MGEVAFVAIESMIRRITPTMKSGITTEHQDLTIRPQDDFFRFHNGAWLDGYEMPADRASDGAMRTLRDEAEAQVREIIEGATGSPDAEKISNLYTSFMDTAAIAARGIAPLTETLALVDSVTTKEDFIALMARLEKEGVGGLWGAFIMPDAGDSTRNAVWIGQGGISLPDEAYYREDVHAPVREVYVAHINTMARLAQATGVDGQSILALETEIASHHWDVVKSREVSLIYNKMPFTDLEDKYGHCLWQTWRDGVELPAAHSADIIVAQPSFFEGLSTMLQNFDLRKDQWCGWLKWSIIQTSASYLTDELVQESFNFFGTTLTGAPELRERWKRAVSLVEGSLGEAIGKVYVERHFPASSKSQMQVLVNNLIEAYRVSITDLQWMTDETKKKALEKLSKFTPKIGYPDKWRDYSALEITADDLIGNVRRISVFQHAFELEKLGKPVDRDEWHMTPQTVNAYYNPLANEIVFPAAILKSPFFDPEVDIAANYGAIGGVIGHEIGHGFDDQGSQFDGDGNIVNWWSDEDRSAFEKQTKKLIAQYDALAPESTPDTYVNGAFTIGENIGDLGGIGIAYKAYRIALGGAEAPVIDGLTGDQRFFSAWAQAWRGKNRPEETRRRIATDPHSPNEFRCNQILRNIDEFYAAYNITDSDGMWLAPEDRVTIW